MRKKQIDLFFRQLDQEIACRATIILVGASAGTLMGHIRPSVDIDFEIRARYSKYANRLALEAKIQKVAKNLGIAVNFSEDISHWSMVSYLDYRKTARFYHQFGKLKVKLIAPEYWTIGKMARFYELDIQDMIRIIRKKRLHAQKLVLLWREAMKTSDLSLELGQFKDHVIYFLRTYSRKLWGKNLDVDKTIRLFLK